MWSSYRRKRAQLVHPAVMKEPPAINNRRPLRSPSLPIQGRASTAENEKNAQGYANLDVAAVEIGYNKRATVGIADEKPSARKQCRKAQNAQVRGHQSLLRLITFNWTCLLTTAKTAGRRLLLVTATSLISQLAPEGWSPLNFPIRHHLLLP